MTDNFAEKVGQMEGPTRVTMVTNFLAELKKQALFDASSELIDLGCGTGLVGLELAKEVAKVTMIDSSASMIKVVKQKVVESKASQVDVLYGELAQYQGQPVDGIVMLLVAHHIEDTLQLFLQAQACLKKGGVLVIADLVEEDGSFHEGEVMPHNGFNVEAISTLALESGFEQVKAHLYDIRPKGGREYPLFMLVARK
ncbi:MAG: class I SAM-dependent methyltransferase [Bacteroidia bacterium]|nr:class I SAM-dependent methyltransferase [Bacteroidia bacterium]